MFNWLYKKYYAEDWAFLSFTPLEMWDGDDFYGYRWTIMLTHRKKGTPRMIKVGGFFGKSVQELEELMYARHGIFVKNGRASIRHKVKS